MDREKLKKQLIFEEGYKHKVYDDLNGHKTIGVGFNLDRPDAKLLIEEMGVSYSDLVAGRGQLTDLQILSLLNTCINDAESTARGIYKTYEEMVEPRQRALCDMAFNLGYDNLSKFDVTNMLMDAGKWGKVCLRLTQSLWLRQVGERAIRIIIMLYLGDKCPDLL